MHLFRAEKLVFLVCLFILPVYLGGQSIDELQFKIAERNKQIQEIEKEIAEYQVQIETTGKEAKTLQSAIKTIDLEQKKLLAEIRSAEAKISSVTLSIQELAKEISLKEGRIGGNRSAIAETLRSMNETENTTLVEAFFSNNTLSSFFETVDALERIETSVREDLKETEALKADLESDKKKSELSKKKLLALRSELKDRTELLAQNKKTKNSILTATKSKEAEYKRLMAEKVALRDAFERELLKFESELQFAIDPSRLPSTGSGVLRWPLDIVKITQEFGDTSFSRSGGYNGKGHNGVDFRASVGTPIKASLSGIVKGIGNTDNVCAGASYGKWVLIEHANGLSTLYAHLSLIKVGAGQEVETGEIVGYSGDTGYATGPHLHFTVYATQGVKIMNRKSTVCKGTYTMPIADLKAYLNPLSYL